MRSSRGLSSPLHSILTFSKPRRPISLASTSNLSFSTRATTSRLQRTVTRQLLPSPRLAPSAHLSHSSSAKSPSPQASGSSPSMDAAKSETGKGNEAQEASSSRTPLPALPAVEGGPSSTLEVGGAALRMDHLGPLVVNEDGTMSRITNWDTMADIEREITLRIIGKRNQARLAKLRAAKKLDENPKTASADATETK
ncbi:hypothetical protein F4808DRAFT_420906 [Astrocystis sublimbata]|nr:hypothetical protein F4808DRAFT_420906 [Astrocystis sublimbata]